MDRPKTIFIDIDGTLLYHHGLIKQQSTIPPQILPGVLEKFEEWNKKGYKIIVVTGRRESERIDTEAQLRLIGIVYDLLIMNAGSGERILINDIKPGTTDSTAIAICVNRNDGIKDIDI